MNSSKPFERSFTLDKIYIHGNDFRGLYDITHNLQELVQLQ